MFAPMIVV